MTSNRDSLSRSTEFNSDFCVFIRKNGKQCMLCPDRDPLSQGRCFRHRIIKKLQEMTPEQRQKNWQKRDKEKKEHGTNFKSLEEKVIDEYWEKYFKSYDIPREYYHDFESNSNDIFRKPVSNDILNDRAITTKEEWKNWIVRNHPDRGGDTKMFIDVLKAGKSFFEKEENNT